MIERPDSRFDDCHFILLFKMSYVSNCMPSLKSQKSFFPLFFSSFFLLLPFLLLPFSLLFPILRFFFSSYVFLFILYLLFYFSFFLFRFERVWTDMEKVIFVDKFLQFPKNFSKIASFLTNRSTKDCVRFYYDSKVGKWD